MLSLQLHMHNGMAEHKGQKQQSYTKEYSTACHLLKGWEVQAKFSDNRRKISSHMPAEHCLIKKRNTIKSCWHILQDTSVWHSESFNNSELKVKEAAFFQPKIIA